MDKIVMFVFFVMFVVFSVSAYVLSGTPEGQTSLIYACIFVCSWGLSILILQIDEKISRLEYLIDREARKLHTYKVINDEANRARGIR